MNEISVISVSLSRPISRCSARHLPSLQGFLISTCQLVAITHHVNETVLNILYNHEDPCNTSMMDAEGRYY